MMRPSQRPSSRGLCCRSRQLSRRRLVIREKLKTDCLFEAYDEAGIQVQNVSKLVAPSQSSTTSAEVTLNALNASESEGDVESLGFGEGEQVR